MTNVVFLQAYVDFTSSMPLMEVAGKIADVCFGGGEFVGENEGIWDEIPALRLNRSILGLEVILGGRPGADGGYTLQVSSMEPFGGDIPADPDGSKAAICDFSTYLTALLQRISGIQCAR